MPNPVLILAGINNSGPEHWQTLWQKKFPHLSKLEQRDWDHPVCSEWVASLEEAVHLSGPKTILVAHSLACLMVAHWAAQSSLPIQAALLVSIPDPQGKSFPKEASGFENVPVTPFHFPSIVVASSNDPYGSLDHMQTCAANWGSRFIAIGAYGHINASSGLGDWQQGYDILASLQAA